MRWRRNETARQHHTPMTRCRPGRGAYHQFSLSLSPHLSPSPSDPVPLDPVHTDAPTTTHADVAAPSSCRSLPCNAEHALIPLPHAKRRLKACDDASASPSPSNFIVRSPLSHLKSESLTAYLRTYYSTFHSLFLLLFTTTVCT